MTATRAFDITCPVIDQRSLDRNADVTYDHPHQPHEYVGVDRLPPSDADPGATLITSRSPLSLRKHTEALARYFRREFDYDFVNFAASERDARCEAWLWASHGDGRLYATGHAVFWRIAFTDRPGPEWELGSVWQHPYWRGRGRLTAIWPHWARCYGPFWIATPWSPAMQGFMSRRPDHRFPDGTTALRVLDAYGDAERRQLLRDREEVKEHAARGAAI